VYSLPLPQLIEELWGLVPYMWWFLYPTSPEE
jgi:hypothetical protein